MNTTSEADDSKSSEQVSFRESLNLLDRARTWILWKSIITVSFLMVAMALLVIPSLNSWRVQGLNIDRIDIVLAILGVTAIINVLMLLNVRRLKEMRSHLTDQIQFTQKQRRRADKFYGLSIVDPLTGLNNRRFGEEKLQKEIDRAEKGLTDLAIITADLDYFKEINDRYGHGAGDAVLKEFGRNLRKAIRACDVPIRIGGDEFLVILPDCTRDNAQQILSRLQPFTVELKGVRITVSYCRGVSQYQIGDTTQSIIQRADKSLYSEKASRAAVSM